MRTMAQMALGTVQPYIDNLTNEQIDTLLDNIQATIDDLRCCDDTIECSGTDTE
jgi:hypothetical protein